VQASRVEGLGYRAAHASEMTRERAESAEAQGGLYPRRVPHGQDPAERGLEGRVAVGGEAREQYALDVEVRLGIDDGRLVRREVFPVVLHEIEEGESIGVGVHVGEHVRGLDVRRRRATAADPDGERLPEILVRPPPVLARDRGGVRVYDVAVLVRAGVVPPGARSDHGAYPVGLHPVTLLARDGTRVAHAVEYEARGDGGGEGGVAEVEGRPDRFRHAHPPQRRALEYRPADGREFPGHPLEEGRGRDAEIQHPRRHALVPDAVLGVPPPQGGDLPVLETRSARGELGGYRRVDVVPVQYAQPRELVELVHADVPLLLSTAQFPRLDHAHPVTPELEVRGEEYPERAAAHDHVVIELRRPRRDVPQPGPARRVARRPVVRHEPPRRRMRRPCGTFARSWSSPCRIRRCRRAARRRVIPRRRGRTTRRRRRSPHR